MRCLALAQVWRDIGGHALFVMADATDAIRERLREEGCEIVELQAEAGSLDDAKQTVSLAKTNDAAWLVADGYHFGEEYQQVLKAAGLKVLFIDDYGHAQHYSTDFVLNQNAGAQQTLYVSREKSTQLLLGSRFAMLRREFAAWRGWKREITETAHQVLVTMGGSDPENVTQRMIEAILSLPHLRATVVVGGSNPHLRELRGTVGSRNSNIQILENVANMPELMARADVAVSAAGSTSWEMAFLGLPALLLVLADNQSGVAEELSRRGVVVNLGCSSNISASVVASQLSRLASSAAVRKEMSERGSRLVDGRGAERVVAKLRADSLSLRLVREEDRELLWQWANDPEARSSSFSPESIPWEQHVAWFEARSRDDNCRIFIALDGSDQALGQIRFERFKAGEADVDIAIDSRFRGLGYGSRLIELAADRISDEWNLKSLHAFVKPENASSAKAFEKAGFVRTETVTVKGQPAIHYVRTAK